jgi:hypothetical protein
MSRYEFVPDGWTAPYSLALSWDKPWRAYVALVADKSVPPGQDWIIIRIGCKPPHDHYPDLDDMMRALNESIKGKLPAVTLSHQMRLDLMAAKRDQFDRLRREGIDPLVPLDFSNDDDDDEPERHTPMAYPPLYVLRTAATCPACGTAMHVFQLGCSAFCDADSDEEVEDFFFLQQIESLPKPVEKLLKKNCPGYYFDREEPAGRPYLMNHCRCGAKLDTDYLHGDVGAAFWPDTPEGYEQFQLFILPIDEPILIECCEASGGGDYLDYDNAKPLAELSAATPSGKRRK